MHFNNIILILALLFINVLNAQVINGKVFDAKTNTGIAFANIGVPNKNIGTVSNDDGTFAIDVTGLPPTDTIKFSCIGYNAYQITIAHFKTANGHVGLQPKTTQLKPVVIKPVYTKQVLLGVNTQSTNVMGGFISNDLGSELGTVFKYKGKKPGQLKNVSFNIASSGYDTLLFRINVYKMDGDEPGENILAQPVFVKTAIKSGTVTVDLSKYEIPINGPVLVSLEWVKDLYGDQLNFSFKLFKRVSFARKTSHAQWVTVPGGAGIWGVVETEK